ncbi:NAD(P)H-binding protein [Allosphingosinicella sp.]|uniref:NAD(P)H-binding protein n=1 Tax=Allosphingosinicella sp. TaxID=2823234 RepID=UPI003783DCDF
MPPKTDILVTVFGAGGFLGRYVTQSLLKTGVRVRAAERDPRRAFYLKPLGPLGQFQAGRADITDKAAVAAAVQGADAVINLVGILKGKFQQVHVEGARHVAEAAAAAAVSSLVHISAIGADPNFINRFARMARLLPILPVLRPNWKLQPVHAADLGKAIALAALDPGTHAGKTYELGGPNVMTMAELNRWICETTGRHRAIAELPDALGKLLPRLTGWAPGAPVTWDQWLMMRKDSVTAGPGFEAFGLHPAPLAAVAPAWLVPFRKHGRFAKA